MELMKSIAIKKDGSKMANAMTNSIAVHDAEFKHQVGHKATLEQEKETFMGIYDILPLSKDIKILAEHLEEECHCCIEAYEAGHKNAKRLGLEKCLLISTLSSMCYKTNTSPLLTFIRFCFTSHSNLFVLRLRDIIIPDSKFLSDESTVFPPLFFMN